MTHAYGTFELKCDDAMPDLEHKASHDDNLSLLPADIAMRPLLDEASSDVRSIRSHHTYESAQAGVKRLEAISSTWTKSGLTVAYIG